jgi:hypothetical protein
VEDIEWQTAVHEAAHAVVGIRLGWPLASVSVIPPNTQFKPLSRQTSRQAMAMAMAGSLAEQMSRGVAAADVIAAFEVALHEFFDRLGEDDILSAKAHGLAAGAPMEDLHNMAFAIANYSTRGRGWAQFRKAQSLAKKVLIEHWDAVEELARALQRDPSGESQEIVDLTRQRRGMSAPIARGDGAATSQITH